MSEVSVLTRVKNIQNKAFNTYDGQKHSYMPMRITFKAQKCLNAPVIAQNN